MKIDIKLLCILVWVVCRVTQSNGKVYSLSSGPIDVVIPAHEKDARTLEQVVLGIRQYGIGIRRIVVVSEQQLSSSAEWFPESRFPFSKQDVAREIFYEHPAAGDRYLKLPGNRIGWIYQQFLKLYAPFVIPEISSNVLVLDADTIFLNSTRFIDEHGNPLFNVGSEYHRPYFEHAQRLLPGFEKVFASYSGICHHMLFQLPVLEDLFDAIKSVHSIEPWKAMCRCIDKNHVRNSSLSEYEIYFNFIFSRSKQPKKRFLKWKNMKFNQDEILQAKAQDMSYVSCHLYI